MKIKIRFLFLSVFSVLLAACEKPIVSEASASGQSEAGNVVLRFAMYEQSGFDVTRGATDITEVCSRLNIAVFTPGGDKVKTVSQKQDDASYGTVELSLPAGSYRVVVIAHNGDGSATITSEEKVTFANNKVTDTFYYDGELTVGSERQVYDLTLLRAVAMFRMVITDEEIPAGVSKFKFYYLGGSSTFSPKLGYGCVQSKQTEIRAVNDEGIYEIYTMPHTEDDVLTKLTVTAQDANDNTICERVFENIPITRNQVTRYTGSFFTSGGATGGNGVQGGDFRLMANPEWDGIRAFTF